MFSLVGVTGIDDSIPLFEFVAFGRKILDCVARPNTDTSGIRWFLAASSVARIGVEGGKEAEAMVPLCVSAMPEVAKWQAAVRIGSDWR